VKGLFIVFEGIDGSGKSTQAKKLYQWLGEQKRKALLLREPTDSSYGREIRRRLASDTMPSGDEMTRLFIQDREVDVRDNILPALDSGRVVVMDRYYFSNGAYQGAMGLSWQDVLRENRSMAFPVPQRVFLIDISVETALKRVEERVGDEREVFEKESFLQSVHNNYHHMKDETFVVVNGEGREEEVFSDIENHMKNFLSIL
jgi:dTMP kinase